MSLDLEKLFALQEVDLGIRQSQRSLEEIIVECKRIENQLHEFSTNYNETEILVRMGNSDILKEQVKAIDKQLKVLKKERKEITQTLSEPLVGVYERIRTRDGIALAEVSGNCCQKCNIMIRYQLLQKIRKGQITLCESCGRILYCKPVDASQSSRVSA